jgi:hypothetical protein
MNVIDKFFALDDLDLFKRLCEEQLTPDNLMPYQQRAGHYNTDGEIMGTENSTLSLIQGMPRQMFLQQLVDLDLAMPNILDPCAPMDLFYLSAKKPYQGTWHRDRTNQAGNIPDIVAFILFLNNDWNDPDGGLYFYRSDDDTAVVSISPICNRMVYNSSDFMHGVTPLIAADAVRLSCQIFVPKSLVK